MSSHDQPCERPLYFSVRMRAAAADRHLGGAERLVAEPLWPEVIGQLSHRARSYRGVDTVIIQSEVIPSSKVRSLTALPVRTIPARGIREARQSARQLLIREGVRPEAADLALSLLEAGPAPDGGVMRGAVVMDAGSGVRLEPDQARGVRASRLDYSEECRGRLQEWLRERGLTSFRVIEALAIATKAIRSGAAAEICWSDDPDYTAGYAAGPSCGYCRFDPIKPAGAPRGGRVFFLKDASAASAFIRTLQRVPVLITRLADLE